MKNVKIIVCCHKPDLHPTQEPYLPLHVGKALHDNDLGLPADNTGDNISHKNNSYCELTGIYWAWKNLKNVDVIGLCHYRRYFDFHHTIRWPHAIKHILTKDFHNTDLSLPQQLVDNLEDGQAIVPAAWNFVSAVGADYNLHHHSDDLRVLTSIVANTQPEHIRRAYYRMLYMDTQLCPCNMFLLTWHDFDRYCNWLFPLLQQVEQRIDITHYSTFQQRIYGFMAELLFNVWLKANHFKLIQKPMIMFVGAPVASDRQSALSILLWRLRSYISVRLIYPKEHDLPHK